LSHCWDVCNHISVSQAESICAFSSDPTMVNFAHYFLETEGCDGRSDELQVMQVLTRLVYECVTQDKLGILPIWITLLKVKCFYVFAQVCKCTWREVMSVHEYVSSKCWMNFNYIFCWRWPTKKLVGKLNFNSYCSSTGFSGLATPTSNSSVGYQLLSWVVLISLCWKSAASLETDLLSTCCNFIDQLLVSFIFVCGLPCL
jgi:hypothetical protein